jgi:hypothetical protein
MSNIVQTALELYDKNSDKYDSLMKNIKYYQLKLIDGTTTNARKFHFYDENKKELFNSSFEIIGVHFKSKNEEFKSKNKEFWKWGWAISSVKQHNIIKRVLIYAIELEISKTTNDDRRLVKQFLTKSEQEVDGVYSVDILCSITSYLAKQEFIMPIKNFKTEENIHEYDNTRNIINNDDDIWYFFLTNPPDLTNINLSE